jgi:organic radical activating enzyme
MRTRLTFFIFLRPKPPTALGRQIESQDLRDKFLVLLGGRPHQKFLKDLSKLLQTLKGRRKELMA